MGKIFTIMGKSATGKDHIYKALLQDNTLRLFPLVLYTTRPMRAGEEEGREYFFIDETRLDAMRERGQIIEERSYETTRGLWHYATADEGQIDLENRFYLGIGTLESYGKLVAHYGPEKIFPIYIESEDGIRLGHALRREGKQEHPRYDEVCRRFLADAEDFSEEKIRKAGIRRRFENNNTIEECIVEIKAVLRDVMEMTGANPAGGETAHG